MRFERNSYGRSVHLKLHRDAYWSGIERKKRFEIRFTDDHGKRRFEVIGSRLHETKARLPEVGPRQAAICEALA